MGVYLSSPVTEKETSSGDAHGYSWAASSMQGWRRNQEDAHLAIELPHDTALFAVFDGHGGREVRGCAQTSAPAP
eukprot:4130763-Pleurochrysis_carterae.AAC.1